MAALESAEETEEVALEAHKTSDGDFIGKVEIPDDPSKVMRGGEAAAAADFANYFCSYAFLYHQKQMLTDQHRMQSYHRSILKNRHLFEGKTVVDVGAGSGILSVWSAQAGANKVWAVEFTDMAKHAVQLVRTNGVASTVTVVKGAVEELALPPKSVDVMISEWMGYFLLRESMLDSLIRARDRLLKPGGVMMPSSATMYWAPIDCEEERSAKDQELQETIQEWDSFTEETSRDFGVDFSGLTAAYKREQDDYFSLSSQWCELSGEQVLAEPVAVKHLELHSCTVAEALGVDETPFTFAFEQPARISAFAGWFDAAFGGSAENPASHKVLLSTHPSVGYTHWGQQVFYLQAPLDVGAGDEVRGTIRMYRGKDSARLYKLDLTLQTHPGGGEATGGPAVKATYEIP